MTTARFFTRMLSAQPSCSKSFANATSRFEKLLLLPHRQCTEKGNTNVGRMGWYRRPLVPLHKCNGENGKFVARTARSLYNRYSCAKNTPIPSISMPYRNIHRSWPHFDSAVP